MMKLDILALAAHPDDTELGCAGTLLVHIAQGQNVGVVDFTRGELGTRGSAEIRDQEAAASSKLMGLAVRGNLGFKDGFFMNDEPHQMAIIQKIRKFKPEVLLINAPRDRHPDHGRASELSVVSSFLSGLKRIETKDEDGSLQDAWRPKAVYHYVQSDFIKPDFIVDISNHWDKKMEAIMAFKSQFFNPDNKEENTYISSEIFIKSIEARALEFGRTIGAMYGEGFTTDRTIGVKGLFDLK
jgi:bacillithiol biosynthesis deacetylase BshB1